MKYLVAVVLDCRSERERERHRKRSRSGSPSCRGDKHRSWSKDRGSRSRDRKSRDRRSSSRDHKKHRSVVTGGGATSVGLLLWKHGSLELLFCIFSAIHREEPGRKRPAGTGTSLRRASNTSPRCSIKLCKVAQPVPDWCTYSLGSGDSLHCWLISKSFSRSVGPVTKVTTNHSTPTPTPTEDDRGHLKTMILTLNSFLLKIWALISELWLECKNPVSFIWFWWFQHDVNSILLSLSLRLDFLQSDSDLFFTRGPHLLPYWLTDVSVRVVLWLEQSSIHCVQQGAHFYHLHEPTFIFLQIPLNS